MSVDPISREEERDLRAALAEIGPWQLLLGPLAEGGQLLRAERGGTVTFSQAAIGTDAVIEAVKDAESRARISSPIPIQTGHKTLLPGGDNAERK
jgi:hypothetical protein